MRPLDIYSPWDLWDLWGSSISFVRILMPKTTSRGEQKPVLKTGRQKRRHLFAEITRPLHALRSYMASQLLCLENPLAKSDQTSLRDAEQDFAKLLPAGGCDLFFHEWQIFHGFSGEDAGNTKRRWPTTSRNGVQQMSEASWMQATERWLILWLRCFLVCCRIM